MNQPRKIAVITGSRADYSQLHWLMKGIQKDGELQLQVLVTGSHLDEAFGLTYKEIEQAGFQIDEKLPIVTEDNTAVGVVQSLGEATRGFARALARLKPDLGVVLGDRYEILAAAQACLILKIPLAHLCGGDVTEGAFDEAIRHSITKMSHLHFVTNPQSAERLRQLGEDPQSIFDFGSPGLDHLHRLKFLGRVELEKALHFKLRPKNLLITFHPATLDLESAAQQFGELLKGLEELGEGIGLVFTKSNADPEGRTLNRMTDEFVAQQPNARAHASMGQLLYLSTLQQMDAVVGNSSSGLYEAPSFKIPTVNIGDRQKGRLQASSVINCPPEAKAIVRAIQKAFETDCSQTVNPYGEGHSSERILRKIKEMKAPSSLLKKHFFLFPSPSGIKRVYLVAEAGVNHNGSLEIAKQLIECAAEAGADAVKFQTFKADQVVTRDAEKAEYQKQTTASEESQWSMLKRLELDERAHFELLAHCKRHSIEFLSTPFDPESVDLLSQKLGLGRLKVPSGEITNAPLLLKIASTGLAVIVSTGMASGEEIESALGVLAFGYLGGKKSNPARMDFQEAFDSFEGKKILKEKVILLHCTTEYPAPFQEVNLLAMDALGSRFGLPVGLSDHSEGIAVPMAAAARGAVVIEKHFTLNKGLPGPDHRASLEPEELKAMVRAIRQIEEALGSPHKFPTSSELKNKPIARRSLVASRPIRKGEIFTEENLAAKRPEAGVSPMHYWEWLGQTAEKDYLPDEPIEKRG